MASQVPRAPTRVFGALCPGEICTNPVISINKGHWKTYSLTTLISLQIQVQKKEVAKYHDALHTPLLNIQLDSVSPPYLHILLGIVLKHHNLLEDTTHMLDSQIANQKSEFLTPLCESVKTYGSHWQQLQELKNKHQIEEGCLVFSKGQSDIYRHSQTIENRAASFFPITRSSHTKVKPNSLCIRHNTQQA